MKIYNIFTVLLLLIVVLWGFLHFCVGLSIEGVVEQDGNYAFREFHNPALYLASYQYDVRDKKLLLGASGVGSLPLPQLLMLLFLLTMACHTYMTKVSSLDSRSSCMQLSQENSDTVICAKFVSTETDEELGHHKPPCFRGHHTHSQHRHQQRDSEHRPAQVSF